MPPIPNTHPPHFQKSQEQNVYPKKEDLEKSNEKKKSKTKGEWM